MAILVVRIDFSLGFLSKECELSGNDGRLEHDHVFWGYFSSILWIIRSYSLGRAHAVHSLHDCTNPVSFTPLNRLYLSSFAGNAEVQHTVYIEAQLEASHPLIARLSRTLFSTFKIWIWNRAYHWLGYIKHNLIEWGCRLSVEYRSLASGSHYLWAHLSLTDSWVSLHF